ncbi:hypothetical protein OS493_018010 [Desmophyllum pertusum]|uniref:Uncharacterized protein n=1 Tax=Desmophyllum pertusum TaxID=174260 RepID=A0A9X0CR90_9CNID|nr:hypothetical protein OS493_018010 [Desmophyllum pertusum]
MLPPQALLAAMVYFQFIQLGVSSTSVVTPSNMVTPSPAMTYSMSSNSSIMQSDSSNTATSSATTYAPSTSGAGDQSSTVGGGGQGGSTVSPTTSGAHYSVNPSSSVSVQYVMWSDWGVEKASDCQVKCCDTGGPVIRQIRNCTIIKHRCNGTDQCSYYGPIERDISCYNACAHCMPSSGNIMAAQVVITIIANILAVAVVMTGP